MNGPELAAALESARASMTQVASLLGYRSENSLRQILAGAAVLPEARAAWLRRYVKMRERLWREESEWLAKNPAPDA